MGAFTVTTPVPGHNGAVGGVHFVDGKATVDDKTHGSELAYFRAQGYGVEASDSEPDIDALRAEAADLGLKVHHAAKAETIQKQIDEARAAKSDDVPDDQGHDEENDR